MQNVLAHSPPVLHGHAFFFLHAPLASHVLLPAQVSTSSAFVTGVHVPGVALHVRHAAVHAVSQQ
jgi:hypothetical protein